MVQILDKGPDRVRAKSCASDFTDGARPIFSTAPQDRKADRKAVNSAQRVGPETLPELGVASSKVLLIFLKGLAGRLTAEQPGLRLGLVTHIAFAALLFEDVPRDVINLLELPGTGLRIQLRETVGSSKRSLVDIASPRYQSAPEIFDAVVRAAAVDDIRRAPKVPGVRVVEISAKRCFE